MLQHFSEHVTVYASDINGTCKPGDVVLLEKLPTKATKYITHQMRNIVYPFGDVTDPVTGRKVVVGQYRCVIIQFLHHLTGCSNSALPLCHSDELKAKNELYGENPAGFDYSKAPDRGWQKEKRDFTYQETYRKYHVYEHDDPYAV